MSKNENKHIGWIMALYLTGLFVGALSTGIITPVRTIIQSALGVDDSVGIWMITIYTLFYAAIIPVSGKLADRHGRKIVFIISIFLFGVGSVICGLSAKFDSFAVLLAGRIVQALGAGGIMPIATAEFGTSFPEEKRGMALGLVGGVYGIANVLGATAGSAILDIFGVAHWEWVFYVNIPFCIFVIVGGLIYIPNNKSEVVYKIDKLGTLLMTVIILSLLYGLKNIDFFSFLSSIVEKDVYPFLILAIVLVPLFLLVEKKAEDPIFHVEYLKNGQIVVTLIMGMVVGCSMMGMIFIPQYAENALKMSSGSGGYFVIILGVFAGAASPISGKLIDKFGVKPILGAGFAISIVGALYLAFIGTKYLNLFNIFASLTLIGFGMGLTMGTPLNYMMLANTSDEEANSALATLSLIRSIGTAIAPAIMVGFIIHASAGMQADLMKALPEIPETPAIEQTAELNDIISVLSESEEFKEMLGDTDMSEMLNMDMSMDMDMTGSSDFVMPAELLAELQNSDVTTIVTACKDMVSYMFDYGTKDVIPEIQSGIGEGIDGISQGIEGISTGIAEMQSGVSQMESGISELSQGIAGVTQGIDGMNAGIAQQEQAIAGIQQAIALAESGQMGPVSEDDINEMKAQLAALQGAKAGIEAKRDEAVAQRAQMESALNEMSSGKTELISAIAQTQEQKSLMERARELMQEIKDAIPGIFRESKENYLTAVDGESEAIEQVYQDTLNSGFRNMYICVTAFNVIGLILLAFYKDGKKKTAA